MLIRLLMRNKNAASPAIKRNKATLLILLYYSTVDFCILYFFVNVCPTGALTKVFENNQVVRHLNNSLCNNCNLCQEACPENVISFVEDYAVTDLIEDKTHVVARIDMTSCVLCGEFIPAGHGEICTTCEKRQISPMFMNVYKERGKVSTTENK